jgi:hypothetical protein
MTRTRDSIDYLSYELSIIKFKKYVYQLPKGRTATVYIKRSSADRPTLQEWERIRDVLGEERGKAFDSAESYEMYLSHISVIPECNH